jgi:hypothetical protein
LSAFNASTFEKIESENLPSGYVTYVLIDTSEKLLDAKIELYMDQRGAKRMAEVYSSKAELSNKAKDRQSRWSMVEHTPLPLYFFLAAFFAFVLTFFTILNIKYVLSIYKFTEVD